MNTFHLTILRPKDTLFDGEVAKLFVSREDGVAEVLPGHIPMLMCLSSQKCVLVLPDGTKRTFVTGDGFLSITADGATVMSDFAVWEEHLPVALDKVKHQLDEETARRRRSFVEYKLSQMNMAKLFVRLNGEYRADKK